MYHGNDGARPTLPANLRFTMWHDDASRNAPDDRWLVTSSQPEVIAWNQEIVAKVKISFANGIGGNPVHLRKNEKQIRKEKDERQTLEKRRMMMRGWGLEEVPTFDEAFPRHTYTFAMGIAQGDLSEGSDVCPCVECTAGKSSCRFGF